MMVFESRSRRVELACSCWDLILQLHRSTVNEQLQAERCPSTYRLMYDKRVQVWPTSLNPGRHIVCLAPFRSILLRFSMVVTSLDTG
ncbi:hypothetical protein VTK56DRAFT_5568 [Thermocarpiscus australiensis]